MRQVIFPQIKLARFIYLTEFGEDTFYKLQSSHILNFLYNVLNLCMFIEDPCFFRRRTTEKDNFTTHTQNTLT